METANTELLVRLLAKHQAELFRYIYALLPHEEDARDVLQETSVALYRKFADYDPQRPFLAWAHRFALLEVLKHRERSHRGARLLTPELIQQLAQDRDHYQPVLQARLQALEQCLEQLKADDRELVRDHYQKTSSEEQLIRRFGASRRSLFRRLERIRRLLFECISRRVAASSG